jgi:hypothetical protein
MDMLVRLSKTTIEIISPSAHSRIRLQGACDYPESVYPHSLQTRVPCHLEEDYGSSPTILTAKKLLALACRRIPELNRLID